MLFPQCFQLLEHFIGREAARTGEDDLLGTRKEFSGNDGLKDIVGPNPHFAGILDVLSFQFERRPMVDVVTDVFLVSENLVHHPARPRSVMILRVFISSAIWRSVCWCVTNRV